MSIQNLNPMQLDPQKISTQAQTDENTRIQLSQFFGSPQARNYIQESGNVQNAISRPDSPFAGATVASGGAPPAPGAAPAPISPGATPDPGAPPMVPSQPAPRTLYNSPDEFAAANPNSIDIPRRPVGPMDNVHGARKGLMLAFLGLNKFGAGLAGQQNSYADQFLGDTLRSDTAQREYDQNRPNLEGQARDKAYKEYLGNENVSSEIRQRNSTLNPQQQKANEDLRGAYGKAVDTWTKDPRFFNNPDSFKRAFQFETQGLNIDPSFLDTITKMPQTGSKWTVDYSKDGGVPQGLRDPLGRAFGPNDISGLDKEAQGMWADANTAYKTGQTDKVNIAKQTGLARGEGYNSTKNTTVKNTKTGMSKYVTAAEAQQLTGAENSEWVTTATDTEKPRMRWAQMNDVFDTANQLKTSLPKAPLSADDVGKLNTMMTEYHGPVADVLKSRYLAGASPEMAKLGSNMLAMRDNILAVLGAMGIQASDTRAQALFNAMPNAGDMANTDLVGNKMNNVYRMIDNLQEGIAGSPEQFGITDRRGDGRGGQNEHPYADATGNIAKGTVSKSGKYEWDGKQWVPHKAK